MPCCGGKRMELRSNTQLGPRLNARTPESFGSSADSPRSPSVARPRPAPARPSPPVQFGAAVIRYLAGAPIVVRGPVTRTEYRFSGSEPLQRVARADVEPLLASGYFRRES
jgi:hypothetical protein